MSDGPELNLKLLNEAIERVLYRERDGVPVVLWQGEEMVLVPVLQAQALMIAADAAKTLAALLPGLVKLSE